ncbi:glycosyltransferase [Aestuariivirga sp.]|uniref:glycosyltransferase n=1 Tax=Aestuariivirga sp. TaxID=2650926 RepID=UPI0039E23C95
MKIYVGYDSREDIAWQVCRHSLLRHSTADLPVFPLKLQALRELGLYTRPVDAKASTEFSISRFLTPYLAAYDGWSIFVDCDFVFTTDVRKVLDTLDPAKAVYVVQHDYTPALAVKMDGKAQHVYPRKNWSSFMVFNGGHEAVKALTPEVVNSQTPQYLHRFSWLEDKDIGSLPLSWNFLSGEYPKPAEIPNAIHYTNGGPWFEGHQNTDFGEFWLEERALYEKSPIATA